MATTTEHDDSEERAMPYPEHDKLGPLGSRSSVLADPIELRARLIGDFGAAVTAAKEAAANVERGADLAVHDARKALRRARAILALMGGALPKGERRAVRRALQEARRSLSTIRDHTVAPITLAALELGDDDRQIAKRILDNAAEALPPVAEIKQLLAEAATRAAAQAEALEAALPPAIDEDALFDGLAATYGEARRARRLAKGKRSWFHTWRRRTKELVYELELLAHHAGARTSAIHEEMGATSDTLGTAVDLLMLREFIETHGQGIEKQAIAHLRDTIDAQLDEQMKTGRKHARDVFAQKPKKFAKRLAKSVKRDLTPDDDNDRRREEIDRAMD